MMTNAPRWIVTVLAALTTAAIAAGCGDAMRGGVNEDTTNGVTQGAGKCAVEGATSTCTIEIGRSGSVISCAKGSRTCRGGSWGACAAETSSAAHYTVVAPAPKVSAAADTGQVRALSINSSSSDCTDNPCDPYCKNFPDTPDAALTGDSSTVVTYSESNLTFADLPNGNPPSGFVKKGNDYADICGTCYPASPFPYSGAQACFETCQFDSHCKGTGQNGCEMFGSGTKNYCTGMDVTTPIVCTIPAGPDVGKRRVRMCNRGSADIPINSAVECWQFPGGSPQYPESDPVANTNGGDILDTFNEAVPAGECVTHLLDDSAFKSNGTESIMCNIRTTTAGSVTAPSSGALPANGKTAGSVVSAGAWTTTGNALDTAGNNVSTVNLAAGTATTGPIGSTTPASVSGWSSLATIGASPDAAVASVNIGKGRTATTYASTAAGTSGGWTNPTNAQGAPNATSATASFSASATSVPPAAPGATATGATADGTLAGTWATIGNANSSVDANAVATGSVPARSGPAIPGRIGMHLAGPAIAGANAITSISATIQWNATGGNKVTGRVELAYANGAATQILPAQALTQPSISPALGTATFTWGATQLSGTNLKVSDVSNAKFLRVYGESTDTAANPFRVDFVQITVVYQNAGASGTLRFTNFGIAVPTGATNLGVTVAPTAGSSAAAGVSGTYQMSVYKAGKATLVGSSAAQTMTGPTALTALAPYSPPGLTAADLTDANFAVDLTATASGAPAFPANVDGMTLTLTYDAPAAAPTVTLNGFGLAGVVPVGLPIVSITTNVGFKVSAVNASRNTMTATTTIGGTTIGTPISVNPALAVVNYASTFTNSSGTYSQADLANLAVVLGGDTTSTTAGFIGSVDYVSVTVVYTPASASSKLELGGYGFAVPATATSVSLTMMARWSASVSSARLCYQAYNGATALGTATCSTTGAAPASLNTQQSTPLTIAVADANNLSVRVTATGGASASTANLDYMVAQLTYGTLTTTGVNECNIHNNWSVAKTNPRIYCPSTSVTTYFDFTKTRVFDGVCGPGTRTRWRLFGWDSSTPNTTNIEFRFRSFEPTTVAGVSTCVELPGVFTGAAPAALATARSTPPDTQVCSLVAPPTASCPANVTAYLGNDPKSDLRCLQMDAHGYADTLGAPILNGWTATYDCLPSE